MAWGRQAVTAVAAAVVLVACSSGERREPQAIVGWSVDDAVLHLWIDTCNGDPESEVVETAEDVSVTVVSTKRDPGDACQTRSP